MAVLTNIVAAEDDEIEAVGESQHPVSEWSGIELRNIDTAKIATLHALLTGDLFDDSVAQYEPHYISDAEGALVFRLADELIARLEVIEDENLEAIATELAATEEFETEGWGEEAIGAMLADLAELARVAVSQDQTLFVWIHPLRS